MIKLLDLQRQYEGIREEMDAAIQAVIREAAFIGGRHVQAFEREFAAYQGAAHCVGLANGTDAIEIAIESLGLPAGSEILVPANSFIASSEAVTRSGCRVVFCDCDPATYTLSLEDAERRITPRTRALIAVHLYGQPCDMDAVREFAARHGLRVIEDCAQAHGAEVRGRRVGALGDLGTFSFYPGKNLGAYGDAGAIVTNDAELATRCRMIANHGRVEKYDHVFEGRNSRLDGLQAAVLSVKLRHLDAWTEARRRVAESYRAALQDLEGVVLPREEEWARHVYHLFVVRCAERDGLRKHLAAAGIESGIHYPIALPKLRAYDYLGQGGEEMLANRFDAEVLSLPMGEHLGGPEVAAVAEAVRAFALDPAREHGSGVAAGV
jgi:dTDP-4-amino-4,6-dideoxygalactose transaminase